MPVKRIFPKTKAKIKNFNSALKTKIRSGVNSARASKFGKTKLAKVLNLHNRRTNKNPFVERTGEPNRRKFPFPVEMKVMTVHDSISNKPEPPFVSFKDLGGTRKDGSVDNERKINKGNKEPLYSSEKKPEMHSHSIPYSRGTVELNTRTTKVLSDTDRRKTFVRKDRRKGKKN